jgi:hypothetical protein
MPAVNEPMTARSLLPLTRGGAGRDFPGAAPIAATAAALDAHRTARPDVPAGRPTAALRFFLAPPAA